MSICWLQNQADSSLKKAFHAGMPPSVVLIETSTTDSRKKTLTSIQLSKFQSSWNFSNIPLPRNSRMNQTNKLVHSNFNDNSWECDIYTFICRGTRAPMNFNFKLTCTDKFSKNLFVSTLRNDTVAKLQAVFLTTNMRLASRSIAYVKSIRLFVTKKSICYQLSCYSQSWHKIGTIKTE